jgi:hypothetical protein
MEEPLPFPFMNHALPRLPNGKGASLSERAAALDNWGAHPPRLSSSVGRPFLVCSAAAFAIPRPSRC